MRHLWQRQAGERHGKRPAAWWRPAAMAHGGRRGLELLGWVAGLAVVVWFATEVGRCRWRTIQEVDTSGYFEIARCFARGRLPVWPDEFSRNVGHVWVNPHRAPADAPPGSLHAPPLVTAKYSPGWPLCLTVGYWINGAHGAMWVNPVLAVAGLLVFFLLARELFGAWVAALLTFIWGTSPMMLMYATYPLGHGPELTCTLLALLCTVRWARSGRLRWAVPAGFCAGFLPLIRPTTVLFWPAMALAYVVARVEHETDAAAGTARHPWPGGTSWRALARELARWLGTLHPRRLWWTLRSPQARPWLAAAAGALVPLLFLGVLNWRVYGQVLRSGYYYTNEERAFDFSWLLPRLNAWLQSSWQGDAQHHWLRWRWNMVLQERFFVLDERFWVLCAAGLVLRLRRPGWAWVFTLLFVPNLCVYLSYYYFHAGPVFYRFLFSAAPVCVLAIGFLLDGWVRRWYLVQAALVLAGALWLRAEPPRYFLRRAQVALGEHFDGSKFPWNSPQARDPLTGGHAQRWRAMRTLDLEPWLQPGGPVTVYAPPNRQWEANVYPGVTAYDADVWFSDYWERPYPNNRNEWHGVWGDVNRARRLHAEVTALGGLAGRRALFTRQVQARLDRGEPVYLLLEDEAHPLLAWADGEARWDVRLVYERRPAADASRTLLGHLWLWQVVPAAAPAAGSSPEVEGQP